MPTRPVRLRVREPRTINHRWTSDPTIPHNTTWASVVDISWSLKKVPAVDADDEYLQLTMAGGGVTATSTSDGVTITATIGADDYTTLLPGEYTITIAVDVGGSDWLELRPGQAAKITVVADHHRT